MPQSSPKQLSPGWRVPIRFADEEPPSVSLKGLRMVVGILHGSHGHGYEAMSAPATMCFSAHAHNLAQYVGKGRQQPTLGGMQHIM